MARTRAAAVCFESGCPRPADGRKGRCTKHEPEAWSNSNRSKELPKDWSKRRAAVLKRDANTCYVCGQRFPSSQLDIDHVVPGSDHSMANLAAICRYPCHNQKTQREAAAARKANRERGVKAKAAPERQAAKPQRRRRAGLSAPMSTDNVRPVTSDDDGR